MMSIQNAAKLRVWAGELFLTVLGATFIFSAVPMLSQTSATPQAAPSVVQPNVKLVIGADTIKNNSTGTLSVVGSSLKFATGLMS